jgi:RHS repeat-associated protein
MRRFYSTKSQARTPLGRYWTSEWFMELRITGNDVLLLDDEGQLVRFVGAVSSAASVNGPAEMEFSRRGEHLVVYHWHHLQRLVFEPDRDRGRWRLYALENLSGDQARLLYDQRGRLGEVRDPSGRWFRLRYNQADLVERVDYGPSSGSQFTLTTYVYDDKGHLTEVRDRDGLIGYEYDIDGRLTAEINRLGGRFTFTYDARGRCVHTAGSDGFLERTLEYAPRGRSTRVTDSQGFVTTYWFDEHGSISRVRRPDGSEIRRVRAGLHRQYIDERGGVEQREYDQAGNLRRVISPERAETKYEYDALHLCTRRTNPDGTSWSFEFDDSGRPVSAVNPAGHRWSFVCNEHGRIEKISNPLGVVTTYMHDQCGNCIRRRDPDGGITEYSYDSFGRLVAVGDRAGRSYGYEYGPQGWLTAVRCNGRQVASYRYDAEGHILEFINEDGQRTQLAYSVWGLRVSRQVDMGPRSATTLFAHDAEGRVTKIIDPAGRAIEFTFDPCGRRARVLCGGVAIEEFEHDLAGNVLRYATEGAERVRYEYDAANRLTAKHDAGSGRSTFAYDSMGRVVTAANDWTTVRFQYDAMGNPVEEGQGDIIIRRAFDAMGNCTALTVSDAMEVTYGYDELQRPVLVAEPHGRVHAFEYGEDSVAPRSHAHPNGLVDTCELNREERRLEQRTTWRGLSAAGAGSAREYIVERSGRIAGLSRPSHETFDYDFLGRLTSVRHNGAVHESFEYDLSGNIVHDGRIGARQYDARNRIVRAGTARYEYRSGDSFDLFPGEAAEPHSYRFDGQGRLLDIEVSAGRRVSFQYDPFGRRISKSVGDEVTKFWWDGTSVLREVCERRDEEHWYLFLPRSFRPLAKLSSRVGGDGVEAFDYHLDPIGTPRELTSATGQVVWSATYRAYGAATVQGKERCTNHIRFPGQYYDTETGLHYNIHRYYDPALGRYISEDPIGFLSSTLNLYSYPADPVNRADALGLDCGDPDAVHIYHGTLDEDKLRESGFTTKDKYGGEATPPYVCVSTDRVAAADAINPRTRYDAQDAPAPAVLSGSMSKAEWDRLHADGHLSTNDYGGFGHGMQSSETKARTPEGVAALNKAFGLPGGT